MKKGGSNGEFWKRKKQRPDGESSSRDKNNFKGSNGANKKVSGEASEQQPSSSDLLWSNKLISEGSPVDYTVSIAIPSSILKTAKTT